jgi:chromosome segregation ATPase
MEPEGWKPGFRRRFASREERIARLEEYLKELQAEIRAVQERLAELKAAG